MATDLPAVFKSSNAGRGGGTRENGDVGIGGGGCTVVIVVVLDTMVGMTGDVIRPLDSR